MAESSGASGAFEVTVDAANQSLRAIDRLRWFGTPLFRERVITEHFFNLIEHPLGCRVEARLPVSRLDDR